MLMSTCCSEPIVQETDNDEIGLCSKCFELTEMWVDDSEDS